MVHVPPDLQRALREYGQEHVLAFWEQLDHTQRRGLLRQLQALDLGALRALYEQRDDVIALPPPDKIEPPPLERLDPGDRVTREAGEDSLRRGEVAVILVAGGQGSRLGFDHPKGMYPVGPVSGHSLFQIHAEKVLALARRYGATVPFLVMTSPATQDETVAYFQEHHHFGLPAEHVHFFQQGTMPALDLATGKLLLDEPGQLFTSPNGHGGTLLALAETGLLDRIEQQGVRQVYYFQVDNPLVHVAEPLFLGHHLRAGAEVSCKVIPKESPRDKLGNLVVVDGRLTMIEYSDLPDELARQTDPDGRLRIRAGSPAIHVFGVEFLRRVTRGRACLPFHIARKKVSYLDSAGRRVEPDRENALKFEMFIFDVLPQARRWAVVKTSRFEEFMPLKNATGPDSPATVRQALSDRAARWLEQAGAQVPRKPDGTAAVDLEISPLFALDADELAGKVDPSRRIDGPTFWQ